MTSELKVDKITPASGTNTQIGEAGDTTNLSAGTVTLPTSIITGATEKTSLADADKFLISDSAASGAFKHVQKSNMPSGIYNVVRSAAFSSGDAYMEMTNAFNSTYRNYYIKMEQIKPNTDGADLRVEFGQSDGTYSAAANFGARMYMFNGNLHNYGGTNASGFTPTWSMDNGAWHNVEMYVYDPMSTTDGKHQYVFLSESKRYDQEYGAVFGGGMYGVAAALPRLKVRVNTGNFTEGRITVYGITNTGNV
tara:strand:- start:14 stop:766 length:753 start_codon:yes stop_codon:yes gene_type:complete